VSSPRAPDASAERWGEGGPRKRRLVQHLDPEDELQGSGAGMSVE
jgi:hypothetical protein